MPFLSRAKDYEALTADFHESILARAHVPPSKLMAHEARIETCGREIVKYEKANRFSQAKSLASKRSDLKQRIERAEAKQAIFGGEQAEGEARLARAIVLDELAAEEIRIRAQDLAVTAVCQRAMAIALASLRSEKATVDKAFAQLPAEAREAVSQPDPLLGHRGIFEF